MNHAATLSSLQRRITEMQSLRADERALPTAPELRGLFPDGALRRGSAIAVQDSLQLSLALISRVSASGAWCGAIGLPELGVEAAAELGMTLDRLVLIPRPGRHALSIAGTLSEVFTALLIRFPGPVSATDAARLAARLRDHGTALVVLGSWPGAEGRIRISASHWHGLGDGHGMLHTRELIASTSDRRGPRTHTIRFANGRLQPC